MQHWIIESYLHPRNYYRILSEFNLRELMIAGYRQALNFRPIRALNTTDWSGFFFTTDWSGFFFDAIEWVLLALFVIGAGFLGTFGLITLGAPSVLGLIGGALSALAIHVVYTKKEHNPEKQARIVFFRQWRDLFSDLIHLRLRSFLLHLTSQAISMIKGLITGFATYKVLISGKVLFGLTLGVSFTPALIIGAIITFDTYFIQSTKLIKTGETISKLLHGLEVKEKEGEKRVEKSIGKLRGFYHWVMIIGHFLGQFSPAFLVLSGTFMASFSIPTFLLCLTGAIALGTYSGVFYGWEYYRATHSDPVNPIQLSNYDNGKVYTLTILSSVVKGILGTVGMLTFFATIGTPIGIAWPAAIIVGYCTAWAQGLKVLGSLLKPYAPARPSSSQDDAFPEEQSGGVRPRSSNAKAAHLLADAKNPPGGFAARMAESHSSSSLNNSRPGYFFTSPELNQQNATPCDPSPTSEQKSTASSILPEVERAQSPVVPEVDSPATLRPADSTKTPHLQPLSL